MEVVNITLPTQHKTAEESLLYTARVSSKNQDSGRTGLIKYLIDNKHWSPFEMIHITLEIVTSRAISAQIIRHKSFSFQEFSQRYSEVGGYEEVYPRRQSSKNHQSSDDNLSFVNYFLCKLMSDISVKLNFWFYKMRLKLGESRETARFDLPLRSQTKIYMSGSLRSWIHYLELRREENTQLEHRVIAEDAYVLLKKEFPITFKALEERLE